MRFDQHIENYKASGMFPSIHEPMVSAVVRHATGKPTVYLDLGCCQGLLAMQVIRKVENSRVVGVDASTAYIDNALQSPHFLPLRLKIQDEQSINQLSQLIQSKSVQFVIARRIMPEIAETGGVDLVFKLAHTLRHIGVGVFLQGRVKTKNAVNPLSDIEKESALFQEAGYRLVDDQRGVHFLVPKSTS